MKVNAQMVNSQISKRAHILRIYRVIYACSSTYDLIICVFVSNDILFLISQLSIHCIEQILFIMN